MVIAPRCVVLFNRVVAMTRLVLDRRSAVGAPWRSLPFTVPLDRPQQHEHPPKPRGGLPVFTKHLFMWIQQQKDPGSHHDPPTGPDPSYAHFVMRTVGRDS